MIDTQLRAIIDPCIAYLSRPLARTNVRANHLTIAGFIIGICAVPALAFQYYYIALILISLNRIIDGLDGIHARRTSPTEFGGYLDIVLDFIFYSAIVFGFSLATHDNALAASWLIFSFIGTTSSFLSYAIIAEKSGLSQAKQQNKTIHYLGGLTEGAETIAFFIFICLFPQYFAIAAWIFGVLCWVTTINRIYIARQSFGHLEGLNT